MPSAPKPSNSGSLSPVQKSKVSSESATNGDSSYPDPKRTMSPSETIYYDQLASATAEGCSPLLHRKPSTKEKPKSLLTATTYQRTVVSEAFMYIHILRDNELRDTEALHRALKQLYGTYGYLVARDQETDTMTLVHASKQDPFDLLAELRKMKDGGVWQDCKHYHHIPKEHVRDAVEFEKAVQRLYGAGNFRILDLPGRFAVYAAPAVPSDLLTYLQSLMDGGIWLDDDTPLFY